MPLRKYLLGVDLKQLVWGNGIQRDAPSKIDFEPFGLELLPGMPKGNDEGAGTAADKHHSRGRLAEKVEILSARSEKWTDS